LPPAGACCRGSGEANPHVGAQMESVPAQYQQALRATGQTRRTVYVPLAPPLKPSLKPARVAVLTTLASCWSPGCVLIQLRTLWCSSACALGKQSRGQSICPVKCQTLETQALGLPGDNGSSCALHSMQLRGIASLCGPCICLTNECTPHEHGGGGAHYSSHLAAGRRPCRVHLKLTEPSQTQRRRACPQKRCPCFLPSLGAVRRRRRELPGLCQMATRLMQSALGNTFGNWAVHGLLWLPWWTRASCPSVCCVGSMEQMQHTRPCWAHACLPR
jgi:hypothetical protein